MRIIRKIFGETGVLAAQRTTRNAHCTRPDVANQMIRVLERLGMSDDPNA